MIKGILFALLAVFSWGSAIVMSKKGLESMDAGTLFFYQIAGAVLLSWVMVCGMKKKILLTGRTFLAWSAGIFEPFLAYMLSLYGLKSVSAGIAAVIFSLESVFILILSAVIFSLKIASPYRFILLLTGAMAGSLMAIVPDVRDTGGAPGGYLLIVSGVLSAAFYVVISAKLVRTIEPIILLAGQLTVAFVLSAIFIFISGTPVKISDDVMLLVFLSGVLQYFLAFYFYLYSLKWLSVYVAGAMLYFIPLVSLFLSWLFLDESISFIQWLGVLLTVISVYVLNRIYHQA